MGSIYAFATVRWLSSGVNFDNRATAQTVAFISSPSMRLRRRRLVRPFVKLSAKAWRASVESLMGASGSIDSKI
jgi:hypothetical protein